MSSDELLVNDKYELLALHRGLMEARFNEDPNDRDVMGSPILAKLHRRVVESILSSDSPVGGSKAQWKSWLTIDEGGRHWAIALRYVRAAPWWQSLSKEAKEAAVYDLLSPFSVDSELSSRFVVAAEN